MEKYCFVIAPIGEPNSEIRKRSDKVFKYIIEPSVKMFDYKPIRADHISKPGFITNQIIEYIIHSQLVIVDLTEHNANVFYELAIRHASRKPVIQIIEKEEKIPFDIAGMRTIYFDIFDLDSVEDVKKHIKQQVETIESGDFDFDNPITLALDIDTLNQSKNREQRVLGDLVKIMAGRMEALANLEFEEKLAVLSRKKKLDYFNSTNDIYRIERTKTNFRAVSYLKNWVKTQKKEELIKKFIIPILENIIKIENRLNKEERSDVLEIIEIALDYNIEVDKLIEIKKGILKKSK